MAALPVTSPISRTYFQPQYSCPSFTGSLNGEYLSNAPFHFVSFATPAYGNVMDCTYSSDIYCVWDLTSGNTAGGSAPACATLAPAGAACGWKCPTALDSGSPLADAYIYPAPGNELDCSYANGNTCKYSTDDGSMKSTNDVTCLPVWDSCNGPAKRRYRREDNYTAMLRKKGALAGNAVPSR